GVGRNWVVGGGTSKTPGPGRTAGKPFGSIGTWRRTSKPEDSSWRAAVALPERAGRTAAEIGSRHREMRSTAERSLPRSSIRIATRADAATGSLGTRRGDPGTRGPGEPETRGRL